eukprot:57459-Prorocentrum_minimum.AAC.1
MAATAMYKPTAAALTLPRSSLPLTPARAHSHNRMRALLRQVAPLLSRTGETGANAFGPGLFI